MAEQRRVHRFEVDGSLSLDRAKMSFTLDTNQNPTSVFPYQRSGSHFLIEEWMLLANRLVAKQLTIECRDFALLRKHREPDTKQSDKIVALLYSYGIELDMTSSKSLHSSLVNLDIEQPRVNVGCFTVDAQHGISIRDVVEALLTKPMQMAKYFCTHDTDKKDWWHYGLAFPQYTHFTSPIRRYADVIVHRLLSYTIGIGKTVPSIKEVELMSERCNTAKGNAKAAQDRSCIVFLCMLLKKKQMIVNAIIFDMGSKSFQVIVAKLGIVVRLTMDTFRLQNADISISNETLDDRCITVDWRDGYGNRQYRVFDMIRLKLTVVEKKSGMEVYGIPIPPDDVEAKLTELTELRGSQEPKHDRCVWEAD